MRRSGRELYDGSELVIYCRRRQSKSQKRFPDARVRGKRLLMGWLDGKKRGESRGRGRA